MVNITEKILDVLEKPLCYYLLNDFRYHFQFKGISETVTGTFQGRDNPCIPRMMDTPLCRNRHPGDPVQAWRAFHD